MIGPRSGVGGDGEGSGILSWMQDSFQDDAVPSYFAAVRLWVRFPCACKLSSCHILKCVIVFLQPQSLISLLRVLKKSYTL